MRSARYGRGGIRLHGEFGRVPHVVSEQVGGELWVAIQRSGEQVSVLFGDVSLGSDCACGPVAVELGFVEESLTNLEQGRVRATRRERGVESAMGVHPRRTDAVARERRCHIEHVMSRDKVRLPVGVAVGDRFSDRETFDLAARPGEIGEVFGRQGWYSEP